MTKAEGVVKGKILDIEGTFSGKVNKIDYAVKTKPHSGASYRNKFFHNVHVLVDKDLHVIQLATDEEKNAGCTIGELIHFRVANYHEATRTQFAHLVPPQITPKDMAQIPHLDGRLNITGTLAERSLTLAAGYLQYKTEHTPDDLFALSDMILGYLGNRLKLEGFL